MQNRLTVKIAGQQFSLVADESEAYMKEIAAIADKKIAEAKSLVGRTAFSTGVLATLNMADEAVKLRHQCEQQQALCASQHTEMEALQEQLAHASEELKTLHQTRPDEDPAVLMTEIKRLKKELDELQQLHNTVCEESDAEMARLNEQIDALVQECDNARASIEEGKSMACKVDILAQENDTLRAALKQARIEKETAVKEHTNSLQNELEQLSAALDALQTKESNESAEARKQINALTRENAELRAAHVKVEPLCTEIKSLQTALDAKEAQVRENCALKTELQQLRTECIRNDPAPLRAEIEHLQAVLEDQKRQLDETERLHGQIAQLQTEIAQNDPAPLHAKIEQLTKELGAHQEKAEENDRLRGELEQLRTACGEGEVCPKADYDALSEELEQVKKEFSKAKMQLAGREIGEIGELRRELTRLREMEKEYHQMREAKPLSAELEQLRAERDEARAALEAGRQSASASQEAEAEIKRLKAELNRQIQINQSLQTRDKKKKGGK